MASDVETVEAQPSHEFQAIARLRALRGAGMIWQVRGT